MAPASLTEGQCDLLIDVYDQARVVRQAHEQQEAAGRHVEETAQALEGKASKTDAYKFATRALSGAKELQGACVSKYDDAVTAFTDYYVAANEGGVPEHQIRLMLHKVLPDELYDKFFGLTEQPTEETDTVKDD